mmetsp:Transcript_34527/g.99143  ORF Transcript_34527/g.99143 Transcript_34527/m.99143 type:complete len:464 (-) Transcript_34527:59-1450(-)
MQLKVANMPLSRLLRPRLLTLTCAPPAARCSRSPLDGQRRCFSVPALVSQDKPTIHDPPRVMQPGQMVEVSSVIRNWWAFPAVGFNSILEVPVYKMESFSAEDDHVVGSVVVPNSIFGQPLRKDLLHKCYWYHRRKLAGYDKQMQMYKWEWPGSNRKYRPQKKGGKGRMGRRKSVGKFDGVHAHALRPKDWGGIKLNKRIIWKSIKVMLSVKYAQGNLKVVDSLNLESHKTKYMVHHLRRLLGRRCKSAMLVHEGHVDVNDNCRWASAHIPSVRRENVEGISVYNLLKYHQLVITEAALAKLIREIQTYPKKHGWGQKFATPDGRPAPVPEKVAGWNNAWIARKERLMSAEFRAKEFFQEQQKWKWSAELRGALKIPRADPLLGFRVKEFLLNPEKPVWDKLESLYADDEPLEDDIDIEEFDELVESLENVSASKQDEEYIDDVSEIQTKPLKALVAAHKLGR